MAKVIYRERIEAILTRSFKIPAKNEISRNKNALRFLFRGRDYFGRRICLTEMRFIPAFYRQNLTSPWNLILVHQSKTTPVMFQLRTSIRLKNSPYFCVFKPAVKQMVWTRLKTESETGERRLLILRKKKTRLFCSLYIDLWLNSIGIYMRTSLFFYPTTEIMLNMVCNTHF